MKISYNRLFKLLIDKGMKKTELAKVGRINSWYACKTFKESNRFYGFFD